MTRGRAARLLAVAWLMFASLASCSRALSEDAPANGVQGLDFPTDRPRKIWVAPKESWFACWGTGSPDLMVFYDSELRKRNTVRFDSPNSLTVSLDGTKIAALGVKGLSVTDARSGESVMEAEVEPGVALRGSLVRPGDERGWLVKLAVEDREPNLLVFGASDLKMRRSIRSEIPKIRRSAVDLQTGLLILAAGPKLEIVDVAEVKSGRMVAVPLKRGIVHLAAGGGRVFAGTTLGQVAAVDIREGKVLWVRQLAGESSAKVATSHSGRILCTAQERKIEEIWEVALSVYLVGEKAPTLLSTTTLKSKRKVNNFAVLESKDTVIIASDALVAWRFR